MNYVTFVHWLKPCADAKENMFNVQTWKCPRWRVTKTLYAPELCNVFNFCDDYTTGQTSPRVPQFCTRQSALVADVSSRAPGDDRQGGSHPTDCPQTGQGSVSATDSMCEHFARQLPAPKGGGDRGPSLCCGHVVSIALTLVTWHMADCNKCHSKAVWHDAMCKDWHDTALLLIFHNSTVKNNECRCV